MKCLGSVWSPALLALALSSIGADAAAQGPLIGTMIVELSSGSGQAPGVIVSVTVTNIENVPLCINSASFPYIKLFHPTRMRLVVGSEVGWDGVDFGEATPDQLGQALHMVVVVRPHETLSGFTNIANTHRFLKHGSFEIDLSVQYSDCARVAAGSELASEHVLPLQARFEIPQTWPGVRP